MREYQSITESFPGTGKSVQSDESVASVERNSSREHVDQNIRSHRMSTHRKLESQRMELHQANQWAREKIDLCGDLEMRNRHHHESEARNCQENEKLPRICYGEKSQVRKLKIEELSLGQERDPIIASQLLDLIQDFFFF